MKFFLNWLLLGLMLLIGCNQSENKQEVAENENQKYSQTLVMADYLKEYHTRCDSVIAYFANSKSLSYNAQAARLYSGIRKRYALNSLDNIPEDRLGAGPFWNLPFAAAFCAGENIFAPELKQKQRAYWSTNTS